ncbi:MAG: hypothetical protein ACK4RK_03995 [Gemmataceae bacterium]
MIEELAELTAVVRIQENQDVEMPEIAAAEVHQADVLRGNPQVVDAVFSTPDAENRAVANLLGLWSSVLIGSALLADRRRSARALDDEEQAATHS